MSRSKRRESENAYPTMHKEWQKRLSVWQSEMLHRKERQGKGTTANEGNQGLAVQKVERLEHESQCTRS